MKTANIQIFCIAIEIGERIQKYFINYSSANTMVVLIRYNSQNSCLEQKLNVFNRHENIRTIVSILPF